jgi:hypothetical protein
MSTADSQIRSLVDSFVASLTSLIRQAALDAVSGALKGSGAHAAAPAKSKAAAAPAKAPAAKAGKRRSGEKRTPEMIAQTTERLLAAINATPGQGIEHHSHQLGIATKDLALSVKKLLAEKQVTTKGQKRATRYFPR